MSKKRKQKKNRDNKSKRAWMILIGIAFVVMAVAPFILTDATGRREPLAIVSSANGDHIIVLVRKTDNAESWRASNWSEYEAYSLDDGSELSSLEQGYPGKPLGNIGDAVWIDVMGNAGLVDMRAGRWIIDPAQIARSYPMLGDRLQLCRPKSEDFDGPMNIRTGALCVTGTNGLTYYLQMDGLLFEDKDVKIAPYKASPCPKPNKQWWVLESDECVETKPHPQGGFSLVSNKGWESDVTFLEPRPLEGIHGWSTRVSDAQVLLVQHGGNDAHVTALDTAGKAVWTVGASSLGHAPAAPPKIELTQTRLVLASPVNGNAFVTVHRLSDGALERTLEL